MAQTHPETSLVSLGRCSPRWSSCRRWPWPSTGWPPSGSGALRADSILTAVAAILAAISLSSLVASRALGLWWPDAIAALIVGVIVLREGWSSLNLAATRRFGH